MVSPVQKLTSQHASRYASQGPKPKAAVPKFTGPQYKTIYVQECRTCGERTLMQGNQQAKLQQHGMAKEVVANSGRINFVRTMGENING